MNEIELDIASATDELGFPLCFGPGLHHASAHGTRVGFIKGQADILGEGKILLNIAAVEMIVEDTAQAARLVA